MRRSIPLVLLALLVTAFAPVSSARASGMEDVSWFVFGNIAAPFGDWSDFAGLGFGGGVGGVMPYNEQFGFRGEAGYIKFAGESVDLGGGEEADYNYSMIPINALVEFTMDPDNPIYLVGGLGITIVRFEYDAPVVQTIFGPVGGGSFDDSSTEIGLVAGAGFRAAEQFNIEAKLNIVSDANYLSAGASFLF
jgi:hypothetical protein